VVMAGGAGTGAALGFAGVLELAGVGGTVGFGLVGAIAAAATVSDGGGEVVLVRLCLHYGNQRWWW